MGKTRTKKQTVHIDPTPEIIEEMASSSAEPSCEGISAPSAKDASLVSPRRSMEAGRGDVKRRWGAQWHDAHGGGQGTAGQSWSWPQDLAWPHNGERKDHVDVHMSHAGRTQPSSLETDDSRAAIASGASSSSSVPWRPTDHPPLRMRSGASREGPPDRQGAWDKWKG